MNKLNLFALVLGILALSACASNEVAEETDTAKAEMAEQKEAAESKANAEADKAKADAEAKAEAEKAAAEAKADEAKAEADAKAEEMNADALAAAASTSDSSGNLVSTCIHDNQERIITVVYDSDDTDTVCEVTYEKSDGVQTLWTANNDREYCKERAAEFVEKQEGWGWTCSNLE